MTDVVHVATRSDVPAIVFGSRRVSYAEFGARVDSLARHLISIGVGPDVAVAVAIPSTPISLGALLVWSATRHVDGAGYLVRHLINTAIGVTLAVLVIRTDSRIIRALAPWVYLGAVLGLVLVLSPLGSTINGSRSWIQVPGFSIQPAELAKVALCVGLAMILAERGERAAPPPRADVWLAVVIAGVPILLVLAQPDLGSALVLVMLTLGVVAVSGASRWWARHISMCAT